MTISWFCFFHHRDSNRRLSSEEHDKLREWIRGCPGLIEGWLYVPSTISHPYGAESVAPALALELKFATVADCEGNLGDAGVLQRLADPDFLQSLAGADATQQGMLGRSFDVADPGDDARTKFCTYLVDYPGPADDDQAWLDHYVTSHAGILVKLPGLRVAAVYTPAVVISMLPFRFATAMLRNKVVFDSAPALSDALSSSVRDELRADVDTFPPYSNGSMHVPMDTLVVPGDLNRA